MVTVTFTLTYRLGMVSLPVFESTRCGCWEWDKDPLSNTV